MLQFSHFRSTMLLALSLFCCLWCTSLAADRLVLQRPTLLRRNKTLFKKLKLHHSDTDINYFPLTGDVSTTSRQNLDSSVPRTLKKPFEEALRVTSQDRHEIETDKLLNACRKLKEAMYTVGQDRNAAEIDRNLRKIEALHQRAPPGRRETLRALLEYEKELGVHGPDGRLKDPSGAMGLLWIRRSLAFQERMYSYILEKPGNTAEAALKAYHETLEPYHGWALQQVYSLALKKTTPTRHEIFQKLCAIPENRFGVLEEKETVQDLRQLCDTWRPLLSTWQETFETLGLEDERKA